MQTYFDPTRKTTLNTNMEDDLKNKTKKWKTTSKLMEDDLKKMEDDLKKNGR
jgi:hypothetical protein